MKLCEIKDITQHEVKLDESATPIHVLMILNEINQCGKCTNAVHYNVLLQIVEMFRYGATFNPRYLNEFRTPKDRLDELKALKPEDQVNLANWAMEQLVNENWQESQPRISAALDLQSWIVNVLKAQK